MRRSRHTVFWMLFSAIAIGFWGSTEIVSGNKSLGLLIVLASPFVGLLFDRVWRSLGGPLERPAESPAPISDPNRRLPKPWLRVLFVAILILRLPLAWLAEQMKWIHDRHAALEMKNVEGINPPTATKREAPWSLRILRESGVNVIWVGPGPPRMRRGTDDEGLEAMKSQRLDLERLFPEANVMENRYFTKN
jgi:hypothetical protein